MIRIHYTDKNTEPFDSLCKGAVFPVLTDDWTKVTCKYCLKIIKKGE